MPTAAFLLALSLSVGSWFHSGTSSPIEQAQRSVVRVEAGQPGEFSARQVCTGFVVAPATVMTAAHCLGPQLVVDGVQADVIAFAPAENMDLALLHTETRKPVLHFTLKDVKVLESVLGIGFGNGFAMAMVIRHDVALVRATLPIPSPPPPGLLVANGWIHGMSGGPVVNEAGQVVGIIQRMSPDNTLGYGVMSETMLAFIDRVIAATAPSFLTHP